MIFLFGSDAFKALAMPWARSDVGVQKAFVGTSLVGVIVRFIWSMSD